MNPYSPPKTKVADLDVVLSRRPGYFVAATALMQLAFVALYLGPYLELIRTGAIAPLVGLLSLVSCLVLYVGSIRFAINPRKGKYFFLLACIGLGLSAAQWNLRYLWSYPFLFGCIVAFAAWWLVRGNQRATRSEQLGTTHQTL